MRIKNIFLFSFLFFILLMINNVSAYKELKDIEIPVFYTEITTENQWNEKDIKIDELKDIDKINSFIIFIEGDFPSNTKIELKMDNDDCYPSYWITPSTNTNNYRAKFDCYTALKKLDKIKNKIKIRTNTTARNIFIYSHISYYNKLKYKIEIKGTEYYPNDEGKVFLQLLDSENKPINNSKCFVDIYYPDQSKFIDNQEMSYLENGIYYYDFTAPHIIGVYMVSASCKIPNPESILNYSYDDFECGSTNCGYGWDTYWILTSPATVTPLASYGGTYGLRETGKGEAKRNFTISPEAESISLSFFARFTSLEGGEYIYVYLCNNTKCFLVKQFSQANSDAQWHSYSFTYYPTNFNISSINMIKINASGCDTGDYGDFDNIRINEYKTFNESKFIELRGSGEIHINQIKNDFKDQNVYVETIFDDFGDTYFNGSEFEYREGTTIYNISVTSQSKLNNQIAVFYFITPHSYDCSSLLEFQKWNGTGWEDAINEITEKRSDIEKENCIFRIETLIDAGETLYYRANLDNYQKWEILWSMDIIRQINETIYPFCQDIANGYDYEIPITKWTNVSDDKIISICHYLFDDIYWAEYTYQLYLNDIYGIEGYLGEIAFYRTEIQNKYTMLYLMTLNTTLQGSLPENIWSYHNRTLTDYNQSGLFNFLIENFNSLKDLLTELNTSLNAKIDAINESIFTKLYSIQDELYAINNNITLIYNIIGDINTSISEKIDTINEQINSLNASISDLRQFISDEFYYLNAKINSIQTNITEVKSLLNEIKTKINEVQENITQMDTNIQSMNSSLHNLGFYISNQISSLNETVIASSTEIMNELYGIDGKIDNLISELGEKLMNISNITLNITTSQKEMLGTMIALYGGRSENVKYSYMSFLPLGLGGDDNALWYCKDNETLSKYEVKNISGSIVGIYNIETDIKCTYGCEKNACIIPPYVIWFYVLLLILLMFFLYLYIERQEITF